jgi:ribosomal protein S18 acetylase RimI-like enzyme
MPRPWQTRGMSIGIRPFSVADTEAVVELWRETGLTRSWNDPYQDISRKLTVQPELFLVAEAGGEVVGTVMAGYDGHRGWLYYLASAPARRGEGIARRLVERVEELLLEMGCPKVQLMVRPENGIARGFYAALGYESFETWTTGKRLIAD